VAADEKNPLAAESDINLAQSLRSALLNVLKGQ